jgi:hypothetical protein
LLLSSCFFLPFSADIRTICKTEACTTNMLYLTARNLHRAITFKSAVLEMSSLCLAPSPTTLVACPGTVNLSYSLFLLSQCLINPSQNYYPIDDPGRGSNCQMQRNRFSNRLCHNKNLLATFNHMTL